MTSSENPAAGHMPTHTWIPNQGYLEQEPKEGLAEHPSTKNRANSSVSEEEDEDFEDIFGEDDNDAADYATHYPGAITKAFNRQRRAQEVAADPNAPKSAIPKSNPQKPTANTLASIDDQIKDLSRHVGKLRLTDDLSGLREKGPTGQERSDRATTEQAIDARTRMILLQMINRNIVSEVNGCVSTGKEANVYHALSGLEDGSGVASPHRAIKIHKSRVVTFKNRDHYVTGDHRFQKGYRKGNNRAMVKQWAEKEYRNLNRVHSAGIACPKPIYLRLHVILMEFVGDDQGVPAPKLKDVVFEDITSDEGNNKVDDQWRDLYLQLLAYMRIMYTECRLVHSDLSEYNILYHQGRLWIIDVSQSVEHDHPKSLEFLRMDIKNVNEFFGRRGVDTLLDRTIFEFIISTAGPKDKISIEQGLHGLFTNRPSESTDDAEKEIENEVFRQQYIPQTLEQVYDIEKDAEQIAKKGKGDLVYSDLLADKLAPRDTEKPMEETDSEDEGVKLPGDDQDSALSNAEGDGETDSFSQKRPRGKRFQDKDAKKEHRKQVKEEKRERRETKIPKHIKKRMVKTTSRHKG